ncbi:MAG: aminoacyl-tRNA hydrolase [Victivallaceae bacterium]|nr:aminoacyl-tRNA hydrolase [Victivallaceae bacterium]
MPGTAQNSLIQAVIGLGNPGREYAATRHNAGFMVLDRLLKQLPGTFEKRDKYAAECRFGTFKGRRLILAWPQTFMNESGKCAGSLARGEKLPAESILVIHDDLDLPVGKLRIRMGGGAGGHHGVESVASELGNPNFVRLRVGIGRGKNVVDYVLTGFDASETEKMDWSMQRAADAVMALLTCPLSRAMNQFNTSAEEAQSESSGAESK